MHTEQKGLPGRVRRVHSDVVTQQEGKHHPCPDHPTDAVSAMAWVVSHVLYPCPDEILTLFPWGWRSCAPWRQLATWTLMLSAAAAGA